MTDLQGIVDVPALWDAVTAGGVEEGSEGTRRLARLLREAGAAMRLPEADLMEKIERKATIARRLFASYDEDWKPVAGATDAAAAAVTGVAALLLIDASCAADRALALKRLNGALWLAQSAYWPTTPCAVAIAAIAETLADRLAAARSA